ncbi:MAG: GDSL-type esterase/lipase family protein [Chitinophagales bacterium]
MKKIKIVLLLFFLVGVAYAQEQKLPFWNDIQNFKHKDSIQPPPQHAILFVGSSSFTKWTDVQDYFPGYTIINRGFGGSSLPDLIRYENDVIFKYEPKQIVIYCGENDLAFSNTVTGQMVFERFKQLFTDIRAKYPKVPLIYISMKPSPSRWNMKKKMIEGNELIKEYLKKKKKTVFVSVWSDMIGPDGKPFEDIFLTDKLHMNAKGYALWQKEIKPHLLK